METKILTDVREAASLLLRGDVIAIPTETVYGLAAPIFFEKSVKKIFSLKGRPADNPLIVHISSLDQARAIAETSDLFYLLARAFFPGPLTMVVKKKDCVPAVVSAGLETIGIRMPQHPLTLKLIDEVKIPLAAPSANLSGKPSSTSVAHVLEDFDQKIPGVLDGGPSEYGLESTVVLLEPSPIILRPGAVSAPAIEKVIGQKVHTSHHDFDRPLSPGMKYRHYAPKAKVFLFTSLQGLNHHQIQHQNAKSWVVPNLKAETLYDILRESDRNEVEEVLILLSKDHLSNPALMDRLNKVFFDLNGKIN